MDARSISPRSADVVTTSIPPEGDEYNARRQEELHAAVANKATLTRRFYEMVRDDAPAEQISAIVEVIASLDREIPHISKDLAVSVQGRNLSIFLERMDLSLAKNIKAIERSVEDASLRALTDVAITLAQLTEYVQQLVTLQRETKQLAQEGIDVGRQALAVGVAAQETGVQALGVSTANAAQLALFDKQMAHVDSRLVDVEKVVKALGKASDEQTKKVMRDIAGLRKEIAELRAAAKEAARLAEEHTRLTEQTAELDRRLAEIEAWRAALESRGA